MTLAALDASLIYDCNITDIVLIEICGKLLTIYNIMTAVPVEIVCRPTIKRLIYATYAISLSYQLESSKITKGDQTTYIVECHLRICSSLISEAFYHHSFLMTKPRRSLQVINAAVNDPEGSKVDTLVCFPINLTFYNPLVLRSDYSSERRQVMAGILLSDLRISSKQIFQLLHSPIHPRY